MNLLEKIGLVMRVLDYSDPSAGVSRPGVSVEIGEGSPANCRVYFDYDDWSKLSAWAKHAWLTEGMGNNEDYYD